MKLTRLPALKQLKAEFYSKYDGIAKYVHEGKGKHVVRLEKDGGGIGIARNEYEARMMLEHYIQNGLIEKKTGDCVQYSRWQDYWG